MNVKPGFDNLVFPALSFIVWEFFNLLLLRLLNSSTSPYLSSCILYQCRSESPDSFPPPPPPPPSLLGGHCLVAHGFGTERARLVVQVKKLLFLAFRGISLRTWFQKKCFLLEGFYIFFCQKYPRFLNLMSDFFRLKKVFRSFSKIYHFVSFRLFL